MMNIYRKGQESIWHRQRIAQVANPRVLQGLVDHIVQELAQQQLPQVLASYNAGIPLTFGRISLSLQGIAVDDGKQFLPWSKVSRLYIGIYIGGERLTIAKKGKVLAWQALPISELGDVDLLQKLIEHIMQRSNDYAY
jgi:hypothetical protein